MNPTRPINLESSLRPTAATPAVNLTGERRSPPPRLEPDVSRLKPLDRDAALRILIEEVKATLIERFGTLPNTPAAPHVLADSSNLVSDLARLLQALLAEVAGETVELAQSALEIAEEAVLEGGRRAMAAIAQMPQVSAEVREAVEQMRWLLVRMVEVQARTLPAGTRRRVEEIARGDEPAG
jgi:hypothetical protein